MTARLLQVCKPLLGRGLETLGSNRGPEIDLMRDTVSPGLRQFGPLPWCGIFVFWALSTATQENRATLTRSLGFINPWAPESCDSWLRQASAQKRHDGARVIPAREVTAGDLFLWLRRKELPGGQVGYDRADATHIGIVLAPPTTAGARYPTLEGNTCSEDGGDGRASRDGGGVYLRSRPYSPKGTIFIQLPQHIKDGF